MKGRAGRLSLAGWFLAVSLIAFALHRAGDGLLGAPPLTSIEGWNEWLAAREPLVAAIALVRMLALAGAWYLLVASLVGAVLRLFEADRLVAVVDRLTVPAVRRLLVATAGVTLLSGGSPTLALARPIPAAVASQAATTTTAATTMPPTTATTPTTTSTTTAGPSPTLTMRVLPPGDATPPPGPSPSPPARASPADVTAGTWTVQPGECFWTIAEDVLVRAWGRPVTDAEIVPYWRVLIEENRSRLADRANEDLIFPGQEFSVPAPPAAAR